MFATRVPPHDKSFLQQQKGKLPVEYHFDVQEKEPVRNVVGVDVRDDLNYRKQTRPAKIVDIPFKQAALPMFKSFESSRPFDQFTIASKKELEQHRLQTEKLSREGQVNKAIEKYFGKQRLKKLNDQSLLGRLTRVLTPQQVLDLTTRIQRQDPLLLGDSQAIKDISDRLELLKAVVKFRNTEWGRAMILRLRSLFTGDRPMPPELNEEGYKQQPASASMQNINFEAAREHVESEGMPAAEGEAALNQMQSNLSRATRHTLPDVLRTAGREAAARGREAVDAAMIPGEDPAANDTSARLTPGQEEFQRMLSNVTGRQVQGSGYRSFTQEEMERARAAMSRGEVAAHEINESQHIRGESNRQQALDNAAEASQKAMEDRKQDQPTMNIREARIQLNQHYDRIATLVHNYLGLERSWTYGFLEGKASILSGHSSMLIEASDAIDRLGQTPAVDKSNAERQIIYDEIGTFSDKVAAYLREKKRRMTPSLEIDRALSFARFLSQPTSASTSVPQEETPVVPQQPQRTHIHHPHLHTPHSHAGAPVPQPGTRESQPVSREETAQKKRSGMRNSQTPAERQAKQEDLEHNQDLAERQLMRQAFPSNRSGGGL
jgi:hypothetical protein